MLSRRSHRPALRGQDGFALIAALAVLTIILVLVAAAATTALSSTDTSQRDARSKQALQVAQAGLNVAIEHMNMLSLDLRHLLDLTSSPGLLNGGLLAGQCVISTSTGLTLLSSDGTNPCDPVTENLGTGSYSYQVSPVAHLDLLNGGSTSGGQILNLSLKREIVSSGTVGNVTRRVYEVVDSGDSAKRTLDTSKITCNLLGSVGLLGGLLKGACQLLGLNYIVGLLGVGNILGDLVNSLGLGSVLGLLGNYTDLTLNTFQVQPGSFRECTPGANSAKPWSGAATGCPDFTSALASPQ
jgi:type II secretory pathway pseudopilin PulG